MNSTRVLHPITISQSQVMFTRTVSCLSKTRYLLKSQIANRPSVFTALILIQLNRASDRSRKKKSNFAGFLGTNLISREFRGRFRGKLHQKEIVKKRPILWLFSRQISLEIDRFLRWSDQRFQRFSNRGHHLLFQQQYAPVMNQWQSL